MIVFSPKLFPVGGGYQALSATPAVQIADNESLQGYSPTRVLNNVVEFEFPDCDPLQTFPYVCDQDNLKDTSVRKDVSRSVVPNVVTLGETFNNVCSHRDDLLADEYAEMKARFEIQKWASFSSVLSDQLNAQSTLIGTGPHTLPHSVAALVNQFSTVGYGPIVVHGPPGWLQAAAPATLGTLNLRDQQVYFAASPGFNNHLGPNGNTLLFVSSAVRVLWDETVSSETLESIVENNSRSVLFETRFAGATGCSWAVETTWCV